MASLSLRTVQFLKGGSLSKSLTFSRDITSAAFQRPNVYSNISSAAMKQKAMDRTFDYPEVAGLNDAGADKAVIAGPFHSGNGGNRYAIDTYSRLTVTFFDDKGSQLYFYRDDGTFWERVHIPEDDSAPEWTKFKYIGITHSEFVQKIKPPGV